MGRTNYTQKTLEHLRKEGMTVGVVERHISFNNGKKGFGFKRDLFGFIDIIAIKDQTTIGVQSTSYACISAHKVKIIKEKTSDAIKWVRAGHSILIYGWRKVPQVKGSKRMVWRPKIVEITLEMLEEQAKVFSYR